jgi:hypothetical protein
MSQGHKAKRALQSLGVSIGVGIGVLLGGLYSLQWLFGVVNSIQILLLGCALVAAILYVSFSIRSFAYSVKGAGLRVVRNSLIAVLAGFLFTIATSAYYTGEGVNVFFTRFGFWSQFQTLMTGVFPLWSSMAFVIVSVFSFDYARRTASGPPSRLVRWVAFGTTAFAVVIIAIVVTSATYTAIFG